MQLAHRLLASGLSLPAYRRATVIMNLEAWQDALGGWRIPRGSMRGVMHGSDPAMYFAMVYGEPGTGTWGWRFGGHHVSVHNTIVDGEIVSVTPTFFGANPHEAALSDYQTLRPVAGEEDLARELVHSLDTAQRSVAIISKAAPFDIVQSNRSRIEDGAEPEWISRVFNGLPDDGTAGRLSIMQNDLNTRQAMTDTDREAARYSLTPKGLAAGGMSQAQLVILEALLREYTNRLPEPLATVEHERLMSILPDLPLRLGGRYGTEAAALLPAAGGRACLSSTTACRTTPTTATPSGVIRRATSDATCWRSTTRQRIRGSRWPVVSPHPHRPLTTDH